MSQPAFNFPIPLTDKYQPKSFNEFVGLHKPKIVIEKLASNPFPSAWLFVGASGTGKTTMGLALATAIPAELHHIPSQECNLENIERIRKTCQYVPMAGFKMHLILADEADCMTPAAQVSLLSKLDATNFPPNTIFVFTCNSTERLEPRFLSRCRVLEFGTNGSDSLIAFLEHIWQAENGPADCQPDYSDICWKARGNVRDALMQLEIELMAPTPSKPKTLTPESKPVVDPEPFRLEPEPETVTPCLSWREFARQ